MGKLSLEVPHSLPPQEALQRITALVEHWYSRYGFQKNWTDNACQLKGNFMGIQLEAEIYILEDKVSGSASDPGFLLRGPAHKYLSKKMAEYLNPQLSLEEILRQDA
ncbi:MAG: polyhydroxyalkanoic acid system family protein [Cystobacterineae bacterium]|nr:polyhydroxyalkanoic acid system family protein [Cystobacterineae bacterium]